jgi:hypothetical protein
MHWSWLVCVAGLLCCGGDAVSSGSGGGSSGGNGAGGNGTAGNTPPPAAQCNFGDPCPQGEVCNECATSSCDMCNDCIGLCFAAQPNKCDDHDDCNAPDVCIYGTQTCAPPCNMMGGCDDPTLTCDSCATGSCPGCEDCTGACL